MKLLIVDKMDKGIIPELSSLGLEVDYYPELNRAEILEIIGDYEGLILRSKIKVDREFISLAKNLKFVARSGAGLDNLDLSELEARNIKVINAPEGNRDALAEHAVGMLLSMLHKIHISNKQVSEYSWLREENRGEELMGKTVGILGFGNMGNAFANRLSGFGVNLIAYDKYKEDLDSSFVQKVTLEEFFEKTEVLSIHLPLTKETQGMVDQEFLLKFQKPFYLMNTARGEIVSLKALKYCLDTNHILGAALDVLENEQINQLSPEERGIFDGLIASGKVLFTPHVGGWSHQSYVRINTVLVDKIRNVILN